MATKLVQFWILLLYNTVRMGASLFRQIPRRFLFSILLASLQYESLSGGTFSHSSHILSTPRHTCRDTNYSSTAIISTSCHPVSTTHQLVITYSGGHPYTLGYSP